MLQEAIGYTLTSHGHTVITVENGKALLERVATGEYFDLLITDNHMPFLNGIDAIKQIRANPIFNALPIILHSAMDPYAMHAIEEQLHRLGNAWVISKTGMDDLLDTIAKITLT